MAFVVAVSASACAVEAPILPGGASASAATSAIEFNTADLEFVLTFKPLLQNPVEVGRLILAKPGLSPEVRAIAERSVARAQDEVIQLNVLLDEWEVSTGDLRPHAENAIEATEAIDPTGSRKVLGGPGDAGILKGSPEEQHEVTYLLLLRQQLVEALMLAENVLIVGESPRVRAIAEQMLRVKSRRMVTIDEYLQSINVEPRELR